MNDPHETLEKCIELMRQDVAEFEEKYSGRFAETPHIGKTPKKRKCWRPKSKPEKKGSGK